MSNRTSEIICLVLVAVFVLAGCERQRREKADVLAGGPEIEAISVPSDEAARAIEATGGLNAWKETTKLQFDCVVTFYHPDGSFYLTEQRYEVHPWLNSIQISADEPQETFVWQLSNGQFNVLRGPGQIDAMTVAGRCLAEGILNITTAPVRFLDEPVEFTRQDTAVRIQGQWYYPIDRKSRGGVARTSEAVFYQDRDNSFVDLIRLARKVAGEGGRMSVQYVRGYDYEKVDKGIMVPKRIEIFGTDARDRSRKRLVKIDCHAVKRINPDFTSSR
jgi:hypothetical protein